MFRYFLSRTLRRFLSTYLDDLDVDGISLSIPGLEDWSGGLDLKNVQLKAGAQLYSYVRECNNNGGSTSFENSSYYKYASKHGKGNHVRKERVTLKIGEGSEIGHLSVSMNTENYVVMIEDVVLTIEVERSDVVNNHDDSSISSEFESHFQVDVQFPKEHGENNDTNHLTLSDNENLKKDHYENGVPQSEIAQNNVDTENTRKRNFILNLLAASEVHLNRVKVRLAIFDNFSANRCTSKNDCNENQSKAYHLPTVIEFGIRSINLTTETIPNHFDNIFANFVRKRVNLGGGNIGMWIKVVSVPTDIYKDQNSKKSERMKKSDIVWARSHWDGLSLFQCTEVNVLIQFCLDDNDYGTNESLDDSFVYNNLTDIDERALFGMNVATLKSEHKSFAIYSPPVESIPYKSNFYRVFRGKRRRPTPCSNILADDPASWGCTEKDKHPLDFQMPLPGMIIHISALVPIEINISRRCIEAIDIMHSTFSKPKSELLPLEYDTDDESELPSKSDKPRKSCEKKSQNRVTFDLPVEEFSDYNSISFPEYMQPKNITLAGMHISKVIVRMQIMDEKSSFRNDEGYCFKFLELSISSIAMDHHSLASDQLSFIDNRVEVGRLDFKAMKGIERQNILTAGFTYPVGRAPSQPAQRVFAAEEVLNVAPLALSSTPQNAALHLCYFAVPPSDISKSEGCVEIKLGTYDAHIRDETIGEIKALVNLMKSALSSKKGNDSLSNPRKPPVNTVADREALKNDDWGFSLTTDGGTLNWKDNIFLDMPYTSFDFRKLTANLFFEWISDRVRLEYGRSSIIAPPPKQTPSLASLAEDVRMNILLFLGTTGMSQLEKAIRLRRSRQRSDRIDFMRAEKINRRLSKIASKQMNKLISLEEVKEKLALERQIEKGRRRDLLTRLMSLDSDTLASILANQNMNILGISP